MPLPDREIEIGRRLRVFRETLLISRAAFAGAIGIGTERLASYELARAPLRYGVFKLIANRFHLNPLWLGGGQALAKSIKPFDDSSIGPINPRLLFSEVFTTIFEPQFKVDQVRQNEDANRLIMKMRDFAHALASGPPGKKLDPGSLDLWLKEVDELVEQVAPLLKFNADLVNNLTSETARAKLPSDMASSITSWPELRERIRALTSKRGARSALARRFDVTPSAVSEWMRGLSMPSADLTIRLLAWVQGEKVPSTQHQGQATTATSHPNPMPRSKQKPTRKPGRKQK